MYTILVYFVTVIRLHYIKSTNKNKCLFQQHNLNEQNNKSNRSSVINRPTWNKQSIIRKFIIKGIKDERGITYGVQDVQFK